MKILTLVLFCILTLVACSQKPEASKTADASDSLDTPRAINTSSQSSSVRLNELFSEADAESILGEPAHVTDSTMGSQQGITAYRSAYTADATSVKTGAIFFLAEEFDKVPDAQTKYSFIKASNENHGGFKALDELGDEAYFHSDNENFYFIMARKGNRVVTIKVNKITPKTSLEDFNRVAREIVSKL